MKIRPMWQHICVISATWEMEISDQEEHSYRGQLGQKVSETPTSINKLGVVIHSCKPSFTGGISRRITVQA
jgi:hypothetical protein